MNTRIHNEYRLENGLRIVHESSPTGVIYCGYAIGAGTRHEQPGEEGMAHFCEHMSFKGTEHRRSWHVLNCLESVGGDLNAYTNKQETVYYAAIPKEHFTRAVDLLSDIVFHSTYPQTEIDKEVEVISDEIESYNDSPSELIYDEFEQMLFRGHPLAGNILGTIETLRTFRTNDARRFTQRFYHPANAVFFVYGQVDFKKVIRLVEKHTAGIPTPQPETICQPLTPYQAEHRMVERNTHQAHVLIGNRCYGGADSRLTGLFLLNNLLGGPGMNSRLNLSLRERNGLVYTVDSTISHYTDAGVWSIYFGCDNKDVEHCRRLVLKELRRLREAPLSNSQLAAAKRQLIGQIGVSCDNFESYALAMGKTYLHYNRFRDIDRLRQKLEELDAETLQQTACEIFDESQLTTLIYQ